MSDADCNFARLVEAAWAREPARPALFHGNEVISHGELARRIDAFAEALRQRGAGPGRSVAIWLPNSPAFVEAFFAVLRLGATVAPLGALLRPREVRERLQIADPTVLVTTAALADALGAANASVLVVAASGGAFPEARRELPVKRAPDDVAVLIFTSGTTGTAKAAELSHGGIAWNARAFIDGFALDRDDVQLAAAPFSHVLGMTCIMNSTLAERRGSRAGGSLRCGHRPRPDGQDGHDDRDGGPVHVRGPRARGTPGWQRATAAPRPWRRLAVPGRDRAFRRGDLRLCGARGLRHERGRRRHQRHADRRRAKARVRRASPGRQRAARRRHRRRRPSADRRARRGAGAQPQRHAGLSWRPGGHPDGASIREGWLSTGDIGYIDDDGYLFLVDRKKELIIRSGYNVYPREVEDVIMGLPRRARGGRGRRPARGPWPGHRRAGRARLRRRPRSGRGESVRAEIAWLRTSTRATSCWSTRCRKGRPERSPNARSTARRYSLASRRRSACRGHLSSRMRPGGAR